MKIFTILFVFGAAGENLLENYDRELSTIKLLFYPTGFRGIDDPIEIGAGLWSGGNIDPNKDVKLLIHGWNANANHVALEPVRNAYLKQNVSHVLAADWSEIAGMRYIVARDMISLVGRRICEQFRIFVSGMEINFGRIHIVGHSLGAHIGTHVGRCFDRKIGRMTALDPAGVLFSSFSTDALSRNDFAFLDSIHTSAGLAGEFEIRGHADFYPNQGLAPQPGCETLDVFTFSACSHYRAPLFFAESILLQHSFPAHQCDLSLIQLPAHRNCLNGSGIAFMGENIDHNTRGVFYLETFGSFPFGMGTI